MMRMPLLFLGLGVLTVGGAQDTLHVQLHGAVVDMDTQAPVPDARVEWYDAEGRKQANTRTNSEGNYAFFVHTTGFVELRVEGKGHQPYRQRLPDIEPGECAREFTVRLVPK